MCSVVVVAGGRVGDSGGRSHQISDVLLLLRGTSVTEGTQVASDSARSYDDLCSHLYRGHQLFRQMNAQHVF